MTCNCAIWYQSCNVRPQARCRTCQVTRNVLTSDTDGLPCVVFKKTEAELTYLLFAYFCAPRRADSWWTAQIHLAQCQQASRRYDELDPLGITITKICSSHPDGLTTEDVVVQFPHGHNHCHRAFFGQYGVGFNPVCFPAEGPMSAYFSIWLKHPGTRVPGCLGAQATANISHNVCCGALETTLSSSEFYADL